jgi:hypothetical protein
MGKRATWVILLVSALCLLAGLVALYARGAVLDRDAFADRAVATLYQDEVDEEIATRFTDGVIERSPGLVTLRPALESAAAEVVTGRWFAARFGASMRGLHDQIFGGDAVRPGLHVPGMTAQVQAALSRRTPVLAARLPGDADPQLLSIGGAAKETALLRAARAGDRLSGLAPFAIALGLLGLLAVALGSADRRRGLRAAALTLAGVGGVLAAGWMGARTLTLQRFDTGWGDAVVRTIWSAYLGDLRVWALALAGAGIVVAALTRPAPLRLPSVPSGARGAAALAAGALLLADRALALDLLAAAAAGVLLYVGACRLLAGPARGPLAAGALALLVAVTALATGGPAPAPDFAPAAEATQNGTAARASVRGSRAPSRRRPERICFASMADARLAAEGAAVPRDVVVQRLDDGRVCLRRR